MQHYAVASKENLVSARKTLSKVLGIQEGDIGDFSHAVLSQPTLHKLLTHPIGEEGSMKREGLGKAPLQSALHKLAGVPGTVKGRHSSGNGSESDEESGDLEEALSDAAHRAKPTKLAPNVADALADALQNDASECLFPSAPQSDVPFLGVY